jgi:PASTA domain
VKTVLKLLVMVAAVVPACCSVALANVTLGTTSRPSGSTANSCGGSSQDAQISSISPTSYTVPAGGGQITAWSTNTSAYSPDWWGYNLQLEVLRPQGIGFPAVVATDQEVLPNPLPPDDVQTWQLSNPIKVQAGDVIGVASWSGQLTCFWTGGSTPSADVVGNFSSGPKPPFTGNPIVGLSPITGAVADVSAVLVQPPGLGGRPQRGQRCAVPKLKGTPGRIAKHVLNKLGCKAKIVRRAGHGVPKNAVLSTKPGAGTYKAGRTITVIVRK